MSRVEKEYDGDYISREEYCPAAETDKHEETIIDDVDK
jgi:hypothetical protein